MPLDAYTLAARLSSNTGLSLLGTQGNDSDGNLWFGLHPAGHPTGQTFTIRTLVGWRRLDILFRPGNFASELLAAMRNADETRQNAFVAVIDTCRRDGAEITLTLNGASCDPSDPEIWSQPWRSMEIVLHKGMLPINEGNVDNDASLVILWTSRMASAIMVLLPLDRERHGQSDAEPEVTGLVEGARMQIEVNRYERDRRNRAAALAIHGYGCKACGIELDTRYGEIASGLIEVHHVTPVSKIKAGYIINPEIDLVPLCPNCHAVAHRRSPPFSVAELQELLDGKPS